MRSCGLGRRIKCCLRADRQYCQGDWQLGNVALAKPRRFDVAAAKAPPVAAGKRQDQGMVRLDLAVGPFVGFGNPAGRRGGIHLRVDI